MHRRRQWRGSGLLLGLVLLAAGTEAQVAHQSVEIRRLVLLSAPVSRCDGVGFVVVAAAHAHFAAEGCGACVTLLVLVLDCRGDGADGEACEGLALVSWVAATVVVVGVAKAAAVGEVVTTAATGAHNRRWAEHAWVAALTIASAHLEVLENPFKAVCSRFNVLIVASSFHWQVTTLLSNIFARS